MKPAAAWKARELAPCGTCGRDVLISAAVIVQGVHYHPAGKCIEPGIKRLRRQLDLALAGPFKR